MITAHRPPPAFAPDVARIVRAWSSRAQVRSYDALHDLTPEADAVDFLEDLLPFRQLPAYQQLPSQAKHRILSMGWLIYNHKTVQIESDIIVPTCSDVLQHMAPLISDDTAYAMSQTMTDEAFHTYLSVLNIRLTCGFRGLSASRPRFELITNLLAQPVHSRRLDRLAVATVSEVFISDYLRKVSEAQDIQALHRFSVNAHRLDEGVHAHVFSALLPQVLHDLNPVQAERFAAVLVHGAAWFASTEREAWRSALLHDPDPGFSGLIKALDVMPSSSFTENDFSKVGDLALEHGLVSQGQFIDLVSQAQQGRSKDGCFSVGPAPH